MRLTRDVDTGKWRARAEGGNLDKIQKNSSFSSGDLPFVASRVFLVQHLDPQHCRTELKARDMGRTDWERELGEGLREVPCQGQEENRWYREGGIVQSL